MDADGYWWRMKTVPRSLEWISYVKDAASCHSQARKTLGKKSCAVAVGLPSVLAAVTQPQILVAAPLLLQRCSRQTLGELHPHQWKAQRWWPMRLVLWETVAPTY